MLSFLRSLSFLWILNYTTLSLADTEIINFSVRPSAIVDQTPSWPVLNADTSKRVFRILPAPLGTPLKNVCEDSNNRTTGQCPHELWVMLDLDDPAWVSFSKYTLRLSWPANFPTQFHLETYTPSEVPQLLSHNQSEPRIKAQDHPQTTLRQYARVRSVDTGVRTPSASVHSPQAVPFTLLLEPLYFGVLPKSVIPIVSFIVLVVIIAAYGVAPFVSKYLAHVAEEARNETTERKVRKAN